MKIKLIITLLSLLFLGVIFSQVKQKKMKLDERYSIQIIINVDDRNIEEMTEILNDFNETASKYELTVNFQKVPLKK